MQFKLPKGTLKALKPFASKDPTRIILHCFHLVSNPVTDKHYIEACDGRIIARVEIERFIDYSSDAEVNALIPVDFPSDLQELFKGIHIIDIEKGEATPGMVSGVTKKGFRVTAELLDGTYPNTDKVLGYPGNPSKENAWLDPEYLIRVSKLSSIIDGKSANVNIVFTDDFFQFRGPRGNWIAVAAVKRQNTINPVSKIISPV